MADVTTNVYRYLWNEMASHTKKPLSGWILMLLEHGGVQELLSLYMKYHLL